MDELQNDDFLFPDESFNLDAEQAASVLGVNKTRLSQLTSKGVLPFERRKVETRSRVFYRLNDLLSYQRGQIGFFNPDSSGRESISLSPIRRLEARIYSDEKEEWGANSVSDSPILNENSFAIKPSFRSSESYLEKKEGLLSAKEIKREQEKDQKIVDLKKEVHFLKEEVQSQRDLFRSIFMQLEQINLKLSRSLIEQERKETRPLNFKNMKSKDSSLVEKTKIDAFIENKSNNRESF